MKVFHRFVNFVFILGIIPACGDKDPQDSGSSDAGDSSGDEGGEGGDDSGEEGGDSSGEDGGDSSGEDGGDSSGEGTGEDGDDGGSGGGGDAYAQTACSLFSGDLSTVQAASLEAEASQALIVPSEAEAWIIESAGSDSYVMLEVEDWMVTVRIFATEGIDVEVQGVDQSASQTECEACTGYSDQAFDIHDWGSYVIHLQGEGDIELSAIQEESEE